MFSNRVPGVLRADLSQSFKGENPTAGDFHSLCIELGPQQGYRRGLGRWHHLKNVWDLGMYVDVDGRQNHSKLATLFPLPPQRHVRGLQCSSSCY